MGQGAVSAAELLADFLKVRLEKKIFFVIQTPQISGNSNEYFLSVQFYTCSFENKIKNSRFLWLIEEIIENFSVDKIGQRGGGFIWIANRQFNLANIRKHLSASAEYHGVTRG